MFLNGFISIPLAGRVVARLQVRDACSLIGVLTQGRMLVLTLLVFGFPRFDMFCFLSLLFFVYFLRGKGRSRRGTEGSIHGGVPGMPGTATEVLHSDPLTRQLQLMLLAIQTNAKVTIPPKEGGGTPVDREWIK